MHREAGGGEQRILTFSRLPASPPPCESLRLLRARRAGSLGAAFQELVKGQGSAVTSPRASRSAVALSGSPSARAASPPRSTATSAISARAASARAWSTRARAVGSSRRRAQASISQASAKTLPHEVFNRIDSLSAPRLVEYWEQDPCMVDESAGNEAGTGTRAKGEAGSMGRASGLRFGVSVEAE